MKQLEDLQEFFIHDRFATGIGCRIVSIAPLSEDEHGVPSLYEARCELKVEERHLNGRGISMGGVAFTLGDFAISVCGYANECSIIGLDVTIHYLRAAMVGSTLTAIAKPTKLGRTICNFDVSIYDDNNKLIATMCGAGMVKP